MVAAESTRHLVMRAGLCTRGFMAASSLGQVFSFSADVVSGSRVCLLINIQQSLRRDVQVDLRRGQFSVAKQFLHAPEVGSAVKQVRGEAVSEVCGLAALASPAFCKCASSSRPTLREVNRLPRWLRNTAFSPGALRLVAARSSL